MHCKSLWIKASAKCINVNVQHVQSKSVIKATFNYDKNITVNDVVLCACVERICKELHLMTVTFACAFAAFCAIVRSNIVFI